MRYIRNNKIPTIFGLFILIVGLGMGIILVNSRQIIRLKAKEESIPKNVRVSNITDSSFTISWSTNLETRGFVKWGEKAKSLNSVAVESTQDDNDKIKNHYFTLEKLTANKDYFFIINSDGINYTNNGLPWQIQSGFKLPPPAESNIIYGSVLNPSGQPEKGATVYISAGGGSLLSTQTQQDGTWAIPLSNIRIKDLSTYAKIDDKTSVVEIYAQSGSMIAMATIYPQAAKPVLPLTLGQSYDFKGLTIEDTGKIPSAEIEINYSPNSPTPTSIPEKSVSIESPTEGERFDSPTLEFYGKGPPEETIIISVESENTITGSVKTDDEGKWSWTFPQYLEPGEHTLTATWVDDEGITRNVRRDFSVSAQTFPTTSESTAASEMLPAASQAKKESGINFTIPDNLEKFGLVGLAGVGTFFIVVFLLILFFRRKRKNISTNTTAMDQKGEIAISKNSIVSPGAKVFLFLGVLILISAGGFSLYQLYKNRRTPDSEQKITRLSTTVPTALPTRIVPSIIPTVATAVSPTLVVSTVPTATPTIRALPSPTPTPTLRLTPTQKPTATPTIRIVASPTITPIPSIQLPSAGFSLPTYVLGAVGIILVTLSLVLVI